jgi:glycosyltransferase involved in cell wall biosynthesis
MELELPTEEPILLFFGDFRLKKGLRFLLKSLKSYDGQSFTLVIAGPEGEVTEKEIKQTAVNIPISIEVESKYIKNVGKYLVASDGVICPYLEEFGPERTSHVFQEACQVCRPVICPKFGSFEEKQRRWGIGITYEPGDTKDLINTINTFIKSPNDYYTPKKFTEYNKYHSFERLVEELLEIYWLESHK